MMVKPMETLELHYQMMQVLVMKITIEIITSSKCFSQPEHMLLNSLGWRMETDGSSN